MKESLLPFVEHQIFWNQITTEVAFFGDDSVTMEPGAVAGLGLAAERNGVTSLHPVRILPS